MVLLLPNKFDQKSLQIIEKKVQTSHVIENNQSLPPNFRVAYKRRPVSGGMRCHSEVEELFDRKSIKIVGNIRHLLLFL